MALIQNHLPCVPVRSAGKSQAELVTQILFGETYTVLEEGKEWTQIELQYDGYTGWISSNQLGKEATQDSKQTVQDLLVKHQGVYVPMGSEIPGSVEPISPDKILIQARKFLGSPYLWGGKTAMGIDCSGLVQVVFKTCGIKLLRDASQQITQGNAVAFGEHNKSDLAFFKNESDKIVHVGILCNQHRIIHAAGTVREDFFDEKGIRNNETGKYTHIYHSIRRYF